MTRSSAPGDVVGLLGLRRGTGRPNDPLIEELSAWLSGSPRFRRFVEAYHGKIGKKLRAATELEARRDVRAELRAAHLLLGDRRFDLTFEAYGAGRAGPDFTVTFRGERPFNLEVTRLRRAPEGGYVGQLLAKLHQLPAGAPNAVLVAIEGEDAAALDVDATMRDLRARADRKDEAFFAARGFTGTRGFYARYLRLGGVLVWCEGAAGDARAASWTNRSARIELPGRAARAGVACLRAG